VSQSVLVAGASGFIGQHVMAALKAAQINAVAWDRTTAQKVPHCSHIVNLAAYGVRQGDRDGQAMIDGNVGVVEKLFSWTTVQRQSPHFLQIGSCLEYQNPEGDKPVDESWPLHPTSLYGSAKVRAGQKAMALAQNHDMSCNVLRLFNIYGVGERPERLVPHVIKSLRTNEPAPLTPGEHFRDWLYISDAVAAMITAIEQSKSLEPYQAYNISTGIGTRVKDLALTAARVGGWPESLLQFGAIPARGDEPTHLVGDSSRFQKLTGWRPLTDVPTGIAKMIAAI